MASIFGTFISWARDPQWETLAPAERSARSITIARATPADQARQIGLPVYRQRQLAMTTARGAPAEWASLMATLYASAAQATPFGTTVRAALEWPMTLPRNPDRFQRFGTKGGSLPGVITEATYVAPKHGEPTVVALFFRDLPPGIQTQFEKTFVQHAFVVRLAEDDAFFQKVLARFSARS
jgi:hypothetical protein